MKKIIRYSLAALGIFFAAVLAYFFAGSAPIEKHIAWGVNFSQAQAKSLGLDWKETYLALLDDLGARHIKIAAEWDLIEPSKGAFQFQDLDWKMQEAEQRGAKVMLVVGMKTPRWPECHIPNWAQNLPATDRQKEVLAMIRQAVLRYKDSKNLSFWQVENEPFLPFGVCPGVDANFLKQEIALVKLLDPNHQVVVTESGEWSFWLNAPRYGDIVGTTLYRKVWLDPPGMYFSFPFPPVFYWRKAEIVRWLFNKDVIGVELQAEPWGPGKLIFNTPLQEQEKTMDLTRFKDAVEYARQTGLKQQYFWGAEWWYWMKTKQNDPSIWNEAKKLFIQNQ